MTREDMFQTVDLDGPAMSTASPGSPQVGELIGGTYRVEGVLGSGGMGTVLLALDEHLDRRVAVKLIHLDKVERPSMRTRFREEARAMARVRHSNVVDIYAYGEHQHRPYFAMEYVPGHNLSMWRDSRPELSRPQAMAVLEQLCRGVQAIHDAGALHRDLKPSNVLVGECERVAVVDLGLAALTRDDQGRPVAELVGTPAYLAPEVARAEPLDEELASRVDIYALGVMAFELMTGRLPFTRKGVPAMLTEHGYAEPPRPSEVAPELPPAFDEPILRALAKQPQERTASAEAFRQEIMRAHLAHQSATPDLRILVADDERAALQATIELLKMSFPGADVIGVHDAATAVSIAESERPHVIITDLHMPGGGGQRLTAAIRQHSVLAHTPIVVVTAYGGGPDWRRLQELGADRFLVKPIDVDSLVAVVRSLLERSGSVAV